MSDASLLALHVPIVDMEAPTLDQIETCVSAIRRQDSNSGEKRVVCWSSQARMP